MKSKENNINKTHKEDLGFKIPEDYFSKSKNEILSKVAPKKEAKVVAFRKNKIVWFAAAGIALIFALTVYKQQLFPTMNVIPEIVQDSLMSTENMDLAFNSFFEDDLLLASLFVNDDKVGSFVNNAFIEEVVEDEYLDDFIVDQLMQDDLF